MLRPRTNTVAPCSGSRRRRVQLAEKSAVLLGRQSYPLQLLRQQLARVFCSAGM